MHLSRPQIYLTRISNSLRPGDGERYAAYLKLAIRKLPTPELCACLGLQPMNAQLGEPIILKSVLGRTS